MSEIAEKVVVITGVSSGIGEATARLLAKRGVGARRSERLEKLVADIDSQGGTADFQPVDVRKRSEVVASGTVYCATKFAVGAISEGLRLEAGKDIRVTVISPGVTESDLASTITDTDAQKGMEEFRSQAIPADAIARSIAYAIEQPAGVAVSEIIVRPTGGY